MDSDRLAQDWALIEKWLVMNTQVEPERWFSALDLAEDLNLDEEYVETILEAHFGTNNLERRTGYDRYEYRNFQYRYKVRSTLQRALVRVSVEAGANELYEAAHQVMRQFTAGEWSLAYAEPEDFNDYDQGYYQVTLVFQWKLKRR